MQVKHRENKWYKFKTCSWANLKSAMERERTSLLPCNGGTGLFSARALICSCTKNIHECSERIFKTRNKKEGKMGLCKFLWIYHIMWWYIECIIHSWYLLIPIIFLFQLCLSFTFAVYIDTSYLTVCKCNQASKWFWWWNQYITGKNWNTINQTKKPEVYTLHVHSMHGHKLKQYFNSSSDFKRSWDEIQLTFFSFSRSSLIGRWAAVTHKFWNFYVWKRYDTQYKLRT